MDDFMKLGALRTSLRILAIALVALSATGCASPASISGMTALDAHPTAVPAELENSMQIGTVLGGESTNPMWTSEVGNADYKAALENSLHVARLLSDHGDGQYVVDANLINVDQPVLGFDLTVTSTISYLVRKNASDEALFDDVVVASHTASVGDAFLGTERLRMANEGSIRKNIATFIQRVVETVGDRPARPVASESAVRASSCDGGSCGSSRSTTRAP